MKDYKRLTVKNVGRYTQIKDEYSTFDCLKRLAELEDKIENGTLVELPCKVGDTVYWVTGLDIIAYEVKGFLYDCDGMGLRLKLRDIEPSVSFCLGNRLFFTEAEALKKLEELKRNT